MPVMTLDPKLEQILQQSLQTIGQDGAGIEPGMAEKLQSSLVQFVENQEMNSMPAIVLVPSNLRRLFARFVKFGVKGLSVLAYNEIPDGKQIKIVSTEVYLRPTHFGRKHFFLFCA